MRNILVGAGLILAAAIVVVGLASSNPEPEALQKKASDLDAQILQRRAIAADLQRYRADVERMEARLKEARRTMEPDFGALAQHMKDRGIVALDLMDRQVAERIVNQKFFVLGKGAAQLSAALDILERSGNIVRMTSIDRVAGRWNAEFLAAQAPAPPPQPERPKVPERRWYSWLNDDLRREVEEKERELARLDELIGPIGELALRKGELERMLQAIEDARGMVDIGRLVSALLLEHECMGSIKLLQEVEIDLHNCVAVSRAVLETASPPELEIAEIEVSGHRLQAKMKMRPTPRH